MPPNESEELFLSHCFHCDAVVSSPPSLEVLVDGGNEEVACFCNWACLAIWANVRAGEPLMPDLDSKYFRAGGMYHGT